MKKTLSLALVALTLGFMSDTALAEGSGHKHNMKDMGQTMNMKGIHSDGKLNVIMDGKVNISHGKIKELGWPPMKMDFVLADGVDTSKLSVGQDVMFVLNKGKNGMYEITNLKSK